MKALAFAMLLVGCGGSGGSFESTPADTGGTSAAGSVGEAGAHTVSSGGSSSGGATSATGGVSVVGSGGASGGALAASGGSVSSGGASSGGSGDESGGASGGAVTGSGGSQDDSDSGATPDDAAAGGATVCECTSGPCCDECSFRPFGFLCARDEIYESHCGTSTYAENQACSLAPASVRNRRQNVFCAGDSAACSGRAVHSKDSTDPCPTGQYCHDAADAGALSAACTPGCKL